MKNVNKKLDELRRRAADIKADTNLRHTPSKSDLAVASENAHVMVYPQYLTVRSD